MNGIRGLQRFVLSTWAWESTVNTAIEAAIDSGATVDAIDHAYTQYFNDQVCRGLGYIGFNQLIRERIADRQKQAREQAMNPPAPEPEPVVELPKPPSWSMQNHGPIYGRVWWTVELVGVAGTKREVDTADEGHKLGKVMQAEWLATHAPDDTGDATPADLGVGEQRAVDGATGVYWRGRANATPALVVMWPNPDKPGASRRYTMPDGSTVENASAYREQQTTEAVAA